MTLKVLKDPSIRSLYGPQNMFGRIWDWIIARVWTKVDKPLADLGRLPSSIPKQTFSRALIDTLAREAKQAYGELQLSDGIQASEVPAALAATRTLLGQWAGQIDAGVAKVVETVDGLPMDRETKDQLLRTLREVAVSRELQARLGQIEGVATEVRAELEARIDRAQAAIDQMVLALGDWFDTTMDRVTGWYVRRVKWVLFGIGVIMAAVVNFDVIGYGDELLNDEGLRNRISAQAEAAVAAKAVGELTVQRTGNQQIAALALNTQRDFRITPEEFASGQAALPPQVREALGLDPDPTAPVSEQQAGQALDALNRTLAEMPGAAPVDADRNGVLSPEEEAKAVDDYFDSLRREMGISTRLLEEQFADQGVEMGWKCPGSRISVECIRDRINLQSVISWLAIGLGCTLGGQFWFDLLRQIVNVKTAASGLNTDLKQLTGASGAQAQGSASVRQAG